MSSEAQREALKLGMKIRNIACMDSLAHRMDISPEARDQIRAICDKAMNDLGYESLTDHKARLQAAWHLPTWDKTIYKYRKL